MKDALGVKQIPRGAVTRQVQAIWRFELLGVAAGQWNNGGPVLLTGSPGPKDAARVKTTRTHSSEMCSEREGDGGVGGATFGRRYKSVELCREDCFSPDYNSQEALG